MATLSISNIRSVESAKIKLGHPITMVAGRNRAGKTSIVSALQSLLSDELAPITGQLKSEHDTMLRLGAKKGEASLSLGDDEIAVTYAKGTVAKSARGFPGTLPTGDLFSTGVLSLLDMKGADRNRYFWDVFKCEPSREQLDAYLKEKRTDASSDKLWSAIDRDGWDQAHKTVKTELTTQKGKWEGIAGEKWGAQKAEGWKADVEQPEPTESKPVGPSAREIQLLEGDLASAKLALDEVEKDRASLPLSPDNPAHMHTCPSCSANLMLKSGKLQPYQSMPEAEVKKIREQRASSDGQLSKARADHNRALTALERAKAITEFKEEFDRDAADRRAAEKTEAATKVNVVIARYLILEEALGPNGVRKDVRGSLVEAINKGLNDTAEMMGLGEVGLIWRKEPGSTAEVVTLQIGETPYIAMSGAERWMARAILQIEMAKRTGAQVLLFDEANILDAGLRNGFFAGLAALPFRSVVAMSANKPAQVPDLDFKGLGRSYWIEAGSACAVAEKKADAA